MSNKDVTVVLTGDSGCGKTSLIYRMCSGKFKGTEDTPSPMSADKINVTVQKEKICLTMCDVGGSALFESLRQQAYENADIVVICYSVNERASFEHVLEIWKPEVLQNTSAERPILLVATKTDLRDSRRKHRDSETDQITAFEGRDMEHKILATDFLECSSKTGANVDSVFEKAAEIGMEFRKSKARKSCRQS